jgi:hypothetical protein
MALKDLKSALVEKAKGLGKCETQAVEVDGKKYLLCGTCLAYEDELCDKVFETFKLLGEIFGQTVTWDDFSDDISEIRDMFLEKFEKTTNSEVVRGSTEY